MILCLAAAIALSVTRPAQQEYAVVGATLIDGTGAQPIPDSLVIVRDGRILAAGPHSKVALPEGIARVDARGKTLVPGLIDMHVHLDEDISPSAHLLFGVTSVRDVGSRLVTLQKLRARAHRGEPMPRLLWMGRNIDEGKPSWWGAVAVKDAAGVPKLLADMARQGVDGVKLYTEAGPEVSRAVIREAGRRGWPVTGHVRTTKPSAAARMGISNLEHVSTLLEELRRPLDTAKTGYVRGFLNVAEVDLNSRRAKRLIEALRENRVAVTPTLSVARLPVEGERAAIKVYQGWADLPEGWVKEWRRPYWSFISTSGWSSSDFRQARAAYRKFEEMVLLLDKAGVRIVAGTDSPAPWVLPGAGLVRELELLVNAGLSPMTALQAATGRAAEALKKSAEVGTIRPGLRADFVLLNADPLKDIKALRDVEAVYLSGWPVDLTKLRATFRAATPEAKR